MNLERSILATLTYFDVIQHPLTTEELFRFLWQPPTGVRYEKFIETLAGLKNNHRIDELFGFYFLPGQSELVKRRQSAVVPSEQKLQRAFRAARCITAVPFLKAIFVCNSVGAVTAQSDSDIDLLIVAERKRVWIVRLWTNVVLRIFGLRTYGSHQSDRLCLSFFIDTDNFDLVNVRSLDEDIHFAYWLHHMVPVYDPGDVQSRFLSANTWAHAYIPGAQLRFGSVRSVLSNTWLGKVWKKIWETMWAGGYGNLIEREAKKTQLTKMRLSLQERARDATHDIVINDGIIKLHEHDTRRAVHDAWQERCKKLV